MFKSLGGKRRMAPRIMELMPKTRFRYHEPFLGGGAVFLALANAMLLEEAHLGDMNADLVAAWEAVAHGPTHLMRRLDDMPISEAEYRRVRALDPAKLSGRSRAARFVYLNKTAWGGVWRTNRAGQMNAPYGERPNLRLYDRDNVMAVHAAIARSRAEVRHEDFAAVVGRARRGDVVYFDPPYVPVRRGRDASFAEYVRGGFSLEDQRALRDVALHLVDDGCRVILTNSSAPEALDLYARAPFVVETVHMRRAVSRSVDDRREVPEILVHAG